MLAEVRLLREMEELPLPVHEEAAQRLVVDACRQQGILSLSRLLWRKPLEVESDALVEACQIGQQLPHHVRHATALIAHETATSRSPLDEVPHHAVHGRHAVPANSSFGVQLGVDRWQSSPTGGNASGR